MKRLIFTMCGLTLISVLCAGQDTITVKGRLMSCYGDSWIDNFERFKVYVDDIEDRDEVGQEQVQVNELGEFIFKTLKPGTYRISTLLFQTVDLVVNIDKEETDVILW